MSDRLTQLHLARPGPHEKSGLGHGELSEAQILPYFGPTKHKTRTTQNPTEQLSHTLCSTPGRALITRENGKALDNLFGW